MGMASKGARALVTSRVPNEVRAVLEDRRRRLGVSSMSQLVSDILALHVDRPDLAVELTEWKSRE